jgi:sarcosine oxidase
MTGALMIGAPGSELVSGALRSAREHGLAHELLDADQMRARHPQHRLAAGEIALKEEDAGVLKPELCVLAAARRARELGARIETGSAVLDVRRLAAEYDHVVVAAGAWLPTLLPGFRVQVERQVMTWFRPRDVDEFRPARFPVFMRETPAGGDRFGIPALDDGLVKVGIHHEGEATDIEHLDRDVHDSDRRKVEEFVTEALPGLEPRVQKAVVCMYSNTPDRHFLVGSAPGYPNVTVLGGFSGHGFKFATILGEIAADLATRGGSAYPTELFSPARSLVTA